MLWCCRRRTEMTASEKRRWFSSAVTYFPKDFHVEDKWPFLDINNIKPEAATTTTSSCVNIKENGSNLAALTIAARCMNARGAIAHGQETELYFSIEDMKKKNNYCKDVQAAFDAFGGGTKRLTSTDAIKEELMKNGPVVSTSFVPPTLFEFVSSSSSSRYVVNKSALHYSSRLGNKRKKKKKQQQHELVIIVGWKSMMDFGEEVWITTRPLRSSRMDSILIPFGQHGVDTLCLAPKNSFENYSWQKGPYIDMDVTEISKDWMRFNSVYLASFHESNSNTLRGCGRLVQDYWRNSYIVIRDKDKIAHSRRYSVMEIKWNNEKSRLEMLAVKVWLKRVPMFIWRWMARNGDWLPFF